MKLKGRIRLNMDRTLTFISTLHDGTPIELQVDVYDIEQNDPFLDDRLTVDGWLFVVQEAKQDNRCYLTLPKPSLQFGKQVIVHELQLMPVGAILNDFKPQKQGGKKIVKPVVMLEEPPVEQQKMSEKSKGGRRKSSSKT
jgi:hypothetical protein